MPLDDVAAEILLQALETKTGTTSVYRVAILCAEDESLRADWRRHHVETNEHVRVYRDLCERLGVNAQAESVSRRLARLHARHLVTMMESALESGESALAAVVAADCVVAGETRCYLNGELIGELGRRISGEEGRRMCDAYARIERQEDQHLSQTVGWTRELWSRRLGSAVSVKRAPSKIASPGLMASVRAPLRREATAFFELA
jgi:hypothetical protein